jgi:hypothetical protein
LHDIPFQIGVAVFIKTSDVYDKWCDAFKGVLSRVMVKYWVKKVNQKTSQDIWKDHLGFHDISTIFLVVLHTYLDYGVSQVVYAFGKEISKGLGGRNFFRFLFFFRHIETILTEQTEKLFCKVFIEV